jgi:hypothetical protein
MTAYTLDSRLWLVVYEVCGASRRIEKEGVVKHMPDHEESSSARVLAAHQHLAGDDTDYAKHRNHVGYNKADTYVGHDLSELDAIEGDNLLFAWHLAKTYTTQLLRAGIELPTYEEVARELGLEMSEDEYERRRAEMAGKRRKDARDRKAADRQAAREKAEADRRAAREQWQRKQDEIRAGVIRVEGDILTTETLYDAQLVAAFRAIRGRQYKGGATNTFPLEAFDEVRALLPDARIVGDPPTPRVTHAYE